MLVGELEGGEEESAKVRTATIKERPTSDVYPIPIMIIVKRSVGGRSVIVLNFYKLKWPIAVKSVRDFRPSKKLK